MKWKLGCSGATLALVDTLEGSIDTIARAGFSSLDFWLYRFCTDKDAPMRRDDWREWVAHVRDLAQAQGLEIFQAHCLWDTELNLRFECTPPGEIYRRCFAAARMLDCRRLIFHPVFYPEPMRTQEVFEGAYQANAQWFSQMLPLAEEYQVEIHLENTFDYARRQPEQGPRYMCSSWKDMLGLKNRIDSPWVHICLDTGHANIEQQDIPAMIRAYGKDLGSLHLNDNYGPIGPIYPDLHLFPGMGRIEWKPIFQALLEVDFRGVLNIEPVAELKRVSREMRAIQLRAAREMLANLARENGMEVE